MRMIVAPDKFKGSMTAGEAANAIAAGVKRVCPTAELKLFPLSDGGEGLVEALTGAGGGKYREETVQGPLGEPVRARWGLIDNSKTAVIEMAVASGLALVPPGKNDPGRAGTYGTGELMRAALNRGCRRLLIGIGGSATSDGGAGMAQALGAALLDKGGHPLPPGGLALLDLASIDVSGVDPRLAETEVLVACDVDNPLTGPHGAARIYGPQKGASPDLVEKLDRALQNYARILRRDLGCDPEKTAGAGAAGGLGAGLLVFAGATLERGITLVLDALGFDAALPGADLLITGEGKLDAQSIRGKAPVGVATRARSQGVPVVALAGSIEGQGEDFAGAGITACFAITDGPRTLESALTEGPRLLEEASASIIRLWLTAKQ